MPDCWLWSARAPTPHTTSPQAGNCLSHVPSFLNLPRCESMGMGVAPSEVASLGHHGPGSPGTSTGSGGSSGGRVQLSSSLRASAPALNPRSALRSSSGGNGSVAASGASSSSPRTASAAVAAAVAAPSAEQAAAAERMSEAQLREFLATDLKVGACAVWALGLVWRGLYKG